MRPPSLILPTLPFERIPRLAPPTLAAATGNGSSPWKRRDEKGRERERALYISTSMRAETSPYFSIQSSALLLLHTVSEASVVSRITTYPRDLCSPSMDLIVRQVMHRARKVQTRDSINRSAISWAFCLSLGKAFESAVWPRVCFRGFPAP